MYVRVSLISSEQSKGQNSTELTSGDVLKMCLQTHINSRVEKFVCDFLGKCFL